MNSIFKIIYKNRKTKMIEDVEIFGKFNCLEYIKAKRLDGTMSDQITVQEYVEVNYFNINLNQLKPWDEVNFPIKK